MVKTDKATVVHLLSFCPERRADNLDIVEDALPLVNMPIAVKVSKEPNRVFMARAEEDLPFTFKDGYVHTAITVMDGHAMLVIEEF